MAIPQNLQSYMVTAKQKEFSNDFIETWQLHETWDKVVVRENFVEATKKFKILEEDVLEYNRSCGETDPLMIDPEYAKKNSPTGSLVVHPVFVTAIVFYSVDATGTGTWIRTPGARNPYQNIDILEPFKVGEEITLKLRNSDKYIQRDKHYINLECNFYNESDVLKATWLCALILPPNKEAAEKFANS